eukprot:TRINITY_DN229_c0_g1_i3.p1 TRINITY_DN229_c0_g1~~TRINITY_DN229_c0_g1_i3.p1  ORF type:complete len:269 (-),score=69.19 TRINITY_DN229_c0_g1_i3:102-908(-)
MSDGGGAPLAATRTLARESFASWCVNAWGRHSCVTCKITLDLKRRQDLFSWVIELFWSYKDTMTIDMLLEGPQPPLVFGITSVRDEKAFRELSDIKEYAKVWKSGVSGPIVFYTEHSEAAELLMSTENRQLLGRVSPLMQQLHISDQPCVIPPHKHAMRMVVKLPRGRASGGSAVAAVQLALNIADTLAHLKLSSTALAKSANARERFAQEEARRTKSERLEAAQQQREEKRQKELEAMTPEERERFKEKERKKQEKPPKQRVKILKS